MRNIDRQLRPDARASWLPVRRRRVASTGERHGGTARADALYALIIERAAELASRIARCAEGSDEERELEAIADAIDAYEAVRWPGPDRRRQGLIATKKARSSAGGPSEGRRGQSQPTKRWERAHLAQPVAVRLASGEHALLTRAPERP